MSHKKTNNNKQVKKIKNNNKGYKKVVFVIVLIILFIFIIKNRMIKKNYETTQVILNNENISNKLENDIIFENNQIYMSYNDIKTILDKTLYTEESTGLIITTSDRKLAIINKEEQTLKINGSNVEVKNIVTQKNETLYMAISELKNVYNCEIEKIDETNVITIDMLNKKCIKAYAKKNIKIKEKNELLSSNIDEVKKGNWLYFIDDENGYAKVRTQNGIIGYVKNKLLNNFITERDDFLENAKTFKEENSIMKDITKEDISSFKKRENIINLILQQAIKNDKMYVKISYSGENNIYYERFKIEVIPILKECGVEIEI